MHACIVRRRLGMPCQTAAHAGLECVTECKKAPGVGATGFPCGWADSQAEAGLKRSTRSVMMPSVFSAIRRCAAQSSFTV